MQDHSISIEGILRLYTKQAERYLTSEEETRTPLPTSAQKEEQGDKTIGMSTNDMRENQDCRICWTKKKN
jgi:hypothetical protein